MLIPISAGDRYPIFIHIDVKISQCTLSLWEDVKAITYIAFLEITCVLYM